MILRNYRNRFLCMGFCCVSIILNGMQSLIFEKKSHEIDFRLNFIAIFAENHDRVC